MVFLNSKWHNRYLASLLNSKSTVLSEKKNDTAFSVLLGATILIIIWKNFEKVKIEDHEEKFPSALFCHQINLAFISLSIYPLNYHRWRVVKSENYEANFFIKNLTLHEFSDFSRKPLNEIYIRKLCTRLTSRFPSAVPTLVILKWACSRPRNHKSKKNRRERWRRGREIKRAKSHFYDSYPRAMSTFFLEFLISRVGKSLDSICPK